MDFVVRKFHAINICERVCEREWEKVNNEIGGHA